MLSIVIFMLFFNIFLLRWNILGRKPKQKHPFGGLEAEFSPRIFCKEKFYTFCEKQTGILQKTLLHKFFIFLSKIFKR